MPDELFLIDGNSLAYRAFFALPESIATSTGVPTNAIFGFASMLVKILTDYGPKATVVVWDAGSSGRKQVYPEYKAQRSSRPDLLKEQWPEFEPLVDAFGYRNLAVEGYEADDVIASIVELAKSADEPIPVMVVTGDRDAYQLVDDGVQIMTTSRGITDTRVYDRQGVIDRYGIPPELVPDFIGLKGDTSDNIPGVPGIGDKTAADLLQRFGSLESVLDHVDDISGAKRKQNLIEHADAARVSKQLATAQRTIPLELDVAEFVAAPPDRSRLREVFRKFELREPLRRLEEALGSADAAAPAPPATADERALTARARTVPLTNLARLPQTELTIAVRPPETPDDALFAADNAWRFGVYAYGAPEVLVGTSPRPEELVSAVGTRPVIAHDAKSLGEVPQTLAHDTEVAAYLLEPARRAYPFRELCEERGLAATVDDEVGADALLHVRTGAVAARGDSRPRLDRPAPAGGAADRSPPARDGAGRGQARHRAPGRDLRTREGRGRRPGTADLRPVRRGVHARLAQAARGGPVRQAWPVTQAPRQDRLLDRCPGAAGDPGRARCDPDGSSAGAS